MRRQSFAKPSAEAYIRTWNILKARNEVFSEYGMAEGPAIYYYSNSIISTKTFHEGKLHGPYINYSTNYNNVKEEEGFYKNEEKDSVVKFYYKTGVLKSKGFYENGYLYGDYEEWYENGNKKGKTTYIKGRLVGPSLEWYSNGNKKTEIFFKYGELDSIYKTYYINGQIEKQHSYKTGEYNGKCTSWYPNGVKKWKAITATVMKTDPIRNGMNPGKKNGKKIMWKEREMVHTLNGFLMGN